MTLEVVRVEPDSRPHRRTVSVQGPLETEQLIESCCMFIRSSLLFFLAVGACGFAQTLQPAAISNPSIPGSIQPNWAIAADGSALLSWVEPLKDGSYTLRYAVRRGSAWSEGRTIATG